MDVVAVSQSTQLDRTLCLPTGTSKAARDKMLQGNITKKRTANALIRAARKDIEKSTEGPQRDAAVKAAKNIVKNLKNDVPDTFNVLWKDAFADLDETSREAQMNKAGAKIAGLAAAETAVLGTLGVPITFGISGAIEVALLPTIMMTGVGLYLKALKEEKNEKKRAEIAYNVLKASNLAQDQEVSFNDQDQI